MLSRSDGGKLFERRLKIMNEKMAVVCGAIGAVGSAIAQFLGGWDNAILSLLIFMVVDFGSGLACAIFWNKSEKSDNGALSSKACWQGIVKKIFTILLVVCAHYADVLLGCDYIRNAVVIAFCASELISICENAALMGIMPEPVKKLFDKIIDVMKTKGDK